MLRAKRDCQAVAVTPLLHRPACGALNQDLLQVQVYRSCIATMFQELQDAVPSVVDWAAASALHGDARKADLFEEFFEATLSSTTFCV